MEQQLSFDTRLYEPVLVRGARRTAIRTIRAISLAPFISSMGLLHRRLAQPYCVLNKVLVSRGRHVVAHQFAQDGHVGSMKRE